MTKAQREANRAIRIKRQDAQFHIRAIRSAVKKLTAARRRLLRIAAADCRKRKEEARHSRSGLYRRHDQAQAAVACSAGRTHALQQYSKHLGALVDQFALWDAVMMKTKAPRTAAQRSASVRRSESWDLERQNIPAEYLPLWDRYGKQARFAAKGHTPRWERFLEWAQSDEGIEAAHQHASTDAEAYLKEMISEYHRGKSGRFEKE
jgi:hypothetical protein